jgi:hypothetical protein
VNAEELVKIPSEGLDSKCSCKLAVMKHAGSMEKESAVSSSTHRFLRTRASCPNHTSYLVLITRQKLGTQVAERRSDVLLCLAQAIALAP